MRYASPSDLVSRFGLTTIAQVATPERFAVVPVELLQLTIDGGDTSAYTAEEVEAATSTLDVITAAMNDAANEIDFYLAPKYPLPFDPVPAMLVKLACDLARYNLYQAGASDEVKDRHKNATRILEQLGDGRLQLGVSVNNTELTKQPDLPESFSAGRAFTTDSLEDF